MNVTHRILFDPDRPFRDSEEINADIREIVAVFRDLGYDHHAEGELPLRDDVDRFIQTRLCQWGPSSLLHAGGAIPPAVTLRDDGTVDIAFYGRTKALTFRVLADNLVRYLQEDRRDGTKIDGRLPERHTDAIATCAELVAWLRGTRASCAKS